MGKLDQTLAAMQADAADDGARLRFYADLADAELVLLLEHEATEGTIAPRIFDLDEGRVALAFDGEERLAEVIGDSAPYVVLPGRVIAAGLAGQGVGLGLNLGAAAPSILLPAAALAWLVDSLAVAPAAARGQPTAFAAPDLPDPVLQALADKLSRSGIAGARLARVRYADGTSGHLLALPGTPASAEAALARAVAEAVALSGLPGLALDVVFPAPGDPVLSRMAGLSLEARPLPVEPAPATAAPGTDPARPPRLK